MMGSSIGRNRKSPVNDPRSEVSGEDPEIDAHSDPKHADPRLKKRVEDPDEGVSSQEESNSDPEKP